MKECKTNILHGGVKFGMGGNTGRVSGLAPQFFADDTTYCRWLKVRITCKDM